MMQENGYKQKLLYHISTYFKRQIPYSGIPSKNEKSNNNSIIDHAHYFDNDLDYFPNI